MNLTLAHDSLDGQLTQGFEKVNGVVLFSQLAKLII